MTISQAHRDARSQATIDFADAGPLNSQINVYDADDVLLVSLILTKPCALLIDHFIVLQALEPNGDPIQQNGEAVFAQWINGKGEIVDDGDVSNAIGSGKFKLSGTAGTTLYAGAYAQLGLTALS